MKLYLMVFLVFLGSCKEDNKSLNNFEPKDYNENQVAIIHGVLLLPKDYKELTKEEYLLYSEKEDLSKTIVMSLVDFSEDSKADYSVFRKEKNLNDMILIQAGEYVNFSKKHANQFLGMLEMTLKENWGSKGIEYTRLEQKMTQTERSKYIKIKYHLKMNRTDLFFTQYIVTSDFSTFGVLVNNTTGEDWEELIKRIVYKI